MNNLKYTIELDAKGKLIPFLRIVRQQADAVAASVKKAGGQFEKLTELCDSFRRLDLSSKVAVAQNLASGLAEASQGGIGFEQSMADLKAITGIVGSDFERLAVAARVVNVLAAGSKYEAAEVADLAQSFKVAGATAAAEYRDAGQPHRAGGDGAEAGMEMGREGVKRRQTTVAHQTKIGFITPLSLPM